MKAQDFKELIEMKENYPELVKHCKGFMYDSLAYRYIRAREQMAEYEYLRDKQSNINNHTEWKVYRERSNRDILRFIQILDEAIGEHD